MTNTLYPCKDCLFIITCDTLCDYAQKFDMSITKIKMTGRCPYCGNKIKYSKYGTAGQKVECIMCRFSWII